MRDTSRPRGAIARTLSAAFAMGAVQIPSPAERDELTLSGLTRAERAVFGLLAQGHTNDEIALELSVPPVVAARYLDSIIGKLCARNRRHATTRGPREGIVG